MSLSACCTVIYDKRAAAVWDLNGGFLMWVHGLARVAELTGHPEGCWCRSRRHKPLRK